jgi:hypothetical protein
VQFCFSSSKEPGQSTERFSRPSFGDSTHGAGAYLRLVPSSLREPFLREVTLQFCVALSKEPGQSIVVNSASLSAASPGRRVLGEEPSPAPQPRVRFILTELYDVVQVTEVDPSREDERWDFEDPPPQRQGVISWQLERRRLATVRVQVAEQGARRHVTPPPVG